MFYQYFYISWQKGIQIFLYAPIINKNINYETDMSTTGVFRKVVLLLCTHHDIYQGLKSWHVSKYPYIHGGTILYTKVDL